SQDSPLRVRLLALLLAGLESPFRMCHFGASRFNREGRRCFTACRYLFPCRHYPIVKRIGLVELGTVLLDSPTPDVLVGIDLQGRAPLIDCLLEIFRVAENRIVALAKRHA